MILHQNQEVCSRGTVLEENSVDKSSNSQSGIVGIWYCSVIYMYHFIMLITNPVW